MQQQKRIFAGNAAIKEEKGTLVGLMYSFFFFFLLRIHLSVLFRRITFT